jgi:UDP-2,3-diacylglucosamine pyrophosphatase LpxH
MKVKSLFISDTHMGSKKAQSDKLLKVLKEYKFDNLFIVGDFIDIIAMKRKFYWNQDNSNIIQRILKLSKKKCTIHYIIGNHDEDIRTLIQHGVINIGNINLCNDIIHTTIKGEKIYICHGDKWDGFIRMNPWLYNLGDWFYELSIKINKVLNFIRKIFGLKYWSLSAYLKKKVKNAVKFIGDFEKLSIKEAKTMNVDSIMIGHIHQPKIDIIDGINYYNTGDFVESCSYIIENIDGNIELRFV